MDFMGIAAVLLLLILSAMLFGGGAHKATKHGRDNIKVEHKGTEETTKDMTQLNEKIFDLEKECDRYKTVIHKLSNKVGIWCVCVCVNVCVNVCVLACEPDIDAHGVKQGRGRQRRRLPSCTGWRSG